MKLLFLVFLLFACAPAPQEIKVECPADATCDVNVQPPPMTQSQIQYHLQQRDMADDVLVALMVQDMAWRNCWNCYDSYYRDPYWSRYQSRAYAYRDMPPAQRYTNITQNNTTVIHKNVTVINKVAASDPPSVKGPVQNKSPGSPNTSKPAAVPAISTKK